MTADSMPNPEEFAAYLASLGEGDLTERVRDEAYRTAAKEALKVISHASAVRQGAIEAGFSTEMAEAMALSFWNLASGGSEG